MKFQRLVNKGSPLLAVGVFAAWLSFIAVFSGALAIWFFTSATPAPAGPAATVFSPGPGWYFRMGQWKADARTLYAAARYVLTDPGPSGPVKSRGALTNRQALPSALTSTNNPDLPAA